MKIYQTDLLNSFANLTHAFTTKDGGVSRKPFDSLNLAFHVGDDIDDVEKNHLLLAKKLNYTKDKLVHMKQIHSDIVHLINAEDNFTNPPTCDALITDRPNTPLMVMVADCSAILFYDDTQKVIAVAHAGRQGAFKNIVKNVINSFEKDFNSLTDDIHVVIGASIGECCYEVGAEIYKEAQELELEYAMIKKESAYYLDVSKILQTQLLESGVKKEHIEISKECTCCKNEEYFSYRADGKTGRFCGVIELK
ncbi:MAG: peptidoglycan editing factor PgeF [Campylobacterota bacterium]|nr:peptidoglycan editing factor PgeF [Campylobacterota bacterium]